MRRRSDGALRHPDRWSTLRYAATLMLVPHRSDSGMACPARGHRTGLLHHREPGRALDAVVLLSRDRGLSPRRI